METLGLVRNKLAKNLIHLLSIKASMNIFLLFLLSTRNSLLMHLSHTLFLPKLKDDEEVRVHWRGGLPGDPLRQHHVRHPQAPEATYTHDQGMHLEEVQKRRPLGNQGVSTRTWRQSTHWVQNNGSLHGERNRHHHATRESLWRGTTPSLLEGVTKKDHPSAMAPRTWAKMSSWVTISKAWNS